MGTKSHIPIRHLNIGICLLYTSTGAGDCDDDVHCPAVYSDSHRGNGQDHEGTDLSLIHILLEGQSTAMTVYLSMERNADS